MEWHPERKCESGLLETNLVHVLKKRVIAYLSPAKAPKLHPRALLRIHRVSRRSRVL
jgi:hypothetical protein